MDLNERQKARMEGLAKNYLNSDYSFISRTAAQIDFIEGYKAALQDPSVLALVEALKQNALEFLTIRQISRIPDDVYDQANKCIVKTQDALNKWECGE